MAIKDILVHIGGSSRTGAATLAAGLAAQHDAHLVGLHTTATPDIPPYIEAQLGAELLDLQARTMQEAATKAEALFESVAAARGLSTKWHTRQGDVVDMLQLYGRAMDLVVVGQVDPEEPAVAGAQDVAGRLALSLGRPVLAVPYTGAPESVGKRVMVAWDGGRAAARALGDALALFQDDAEVTVLSVNPDSGDDEAAGQDVARHLVRHGFTAEAQHIQANDMEVGAMMLSRAADFGVDMIVMGAYGHARWRELVLGGVTQHMLAHMTVPVLMAH